MKRCPFAVNKAPMFWINMQTSLIKMPINLDGHRMGNQKAKIFVLESNLPSHLLSISVRSLRTSPTFWALSVLSCTNAVPFGVQLCWDELAPRCVHVAVFQSGLFGSVRHRGRFYVVSETADWKNSNRSERRAERSKATAVTRFTRMKRIMIILDIITGAGE